ncbi:endothelin-converting enzyme homolog isoform X2 [Cimex lectularius]|uniref:Endothelin-converting enzyme n=1 Tax=Cimex lectularius TaxID=79782 RepID=A0A8I6S9Q1_CIMLE|nr:endothelin-converting enzyme homolog isoform X2 [Cimex lectularius]
METTNKSHQPLSSQNSIYTIDGSQLQLAPPSEDMKGPKTKLFGKTSKKHLEAFLIFTILIISILLIALCVTIYLVVETKLGVTPYICLTHQCIRTASVILSSMNKSQDPCDNFYNFVCGNFRTERAAPDPNWGNSWFMINEVLIKRDITDFLLQKSQDDDPEFVQKGRTLYNSCVDFSAMEENGLETYWDILNTTGLPKDPFSNPMSAEQWLCSLAKIRRYTGLNIILGVSVKESISNSSTNQIMFSTPDQAEQIFTGFHWGNENKKIMKESLTDDVKNTWVKSVGKIILLVIKSGGGEIKKDELEASISSLVDLNRALWNLENSPNISKSILNEIPEEISVEELQIYLDKNTVSGKSKLNLAKYISILYEDVWEVKIDLNQTKLQVFQKYYFQLISEFLEKVEDKNIGIYIWWNVLENLAPHVNRELSDLINTFWTKLLDMEYGETRNYFCLSVVNQLMAPAAGFFLVEKMENKTINEIMYLIDAVKNVFAEEIRTLPWMDDSTKRSSIEKLKKMSSFVGIPDVMRDVDEINQLYNVTLEEDSYLTNFLNLIDLHSYDMFSSLAEENNFSTAFFDPLSVNAYYNPSANSITVPAGILHFPFYDLGTESLIYGAIGTVIGHEITHGFDSIGRMYDKSGNVYPWWSNRSVEQYTNRTYCFEEEYNNYVIPRLNATVDGVLTLAENLADDGGLRFAYGAYKRYAEMGEQQRLPGLQAFSDEQLFFMSFANHWCSDETDESLSQILKQDEHSPALVRVNVALQNFGRFAEVWKCPAGSKMNPSKKCNLWN